MTLILKLGRLRQEDLELEVSMGSTERPCLKRHSNYKRAMLCLDLSPNPRRIGEIHTPAILYFPKHIHQALIQAPIRLFCLCLL